MVIEMQYIMMPEFPRLSGEEAIEALFDFVDELEEQRRETLTDKQTTALIKLSWGLISSIEAEKRRATCPRALKEQRCKETRFVTRFKKTVMEYISQSVSQALRFI